MAANIRVGARLALLLCVVIVHRPLCAEDTVRFLLTWQDIKTILDHTQGVLSVPQTHKLILALADKDGDDSLSQVELIGMGEILTKADTDGDRNVSNAELEV